MTTNNFFKRIFAIFLAAVMLLGMIPTAFATEDISDIIVNKYADGLDENDCTNVTLEVPGDVIHDDIDVIILLGGGMQANKETVNSAINLFKPLMESGTKVKLGLISLERGQEIIVDLNSEEAVLNPETYEQFIADKFAYINTLPEGTTNLHSQLVEAKRMFDADTSVKAENKYMFVIATGRTYWFDNANGDQSMIANKVNGTYYWGNYLWQSQRGGHTSLYMLPDRYNNSYEAFFADVEKWVKADGDTYVFYPGFDKNDNSAYANWYAKNGKDLRALGIAGSRYGNGIVDPKPTAANFITGVEAAIGSGNNPQNALNYERAQYECVQTYKELVAAGYNCYAICSENPNYQNNSDYITLGAKYKGTSRSQLGHSFMNYLATLGGQAEAPVVWSYTRDENGNVTGQELVENFFAPVATDVMNSFYTCSVGSFVEDFIGYEEGKGNFEFIQNPEYVTLKVGGVTYVTAQVETKEGADFSLSFTKPDAEKATFWLDYYYGNGTTTEKFIWTFGENVTIINKAALTYKLQLTEKAEVPGEYTVITNISAILYPKDSTGKSGEPVEFPIPDVKYPVLPITVTGSKTWADEDDRDGIRPESIIINLLANGEKIASQTVTAENNWTWTFENLQKTSGYVDIVYTVTEEAVDGYEAVVDGFNVTNTHEAEKITVNGTKTWADEDNADGIRPESITINLLANGEVIDTKTVTEADGWAWTFENLYKYENGEEIEYTITENSVEGYETVVDGYNVTNTHEAEKITVNGAKTWVDEDNADGIRPESIKINLLANGVVVDTKTVTEADGWTWSFEDLYKYENGVEIVYTITEDAVEGYESVVDGYNVTNTHEVEEEIIPGGEKEEDEDIDDPEIPLVPADKKPEEKPEVKPETPVKDETPEETEEIEDVEVPLVPNFTAPQTGDSSSLIVWLAVAVVTGTLFIIANAKMRRAAAER